MRRTANQLALLLAIVVVACATACASAPRQRRADHGSLTVGVTTSGGSSSTLTFRVSVEPAGISGSVKADAGVFTTDDVPFGEQVVRLLELPGGCRVENGAERKISVSEQRRFAVLRFDVRCK
jgi:hypothetical protein